jgi:thiol-disulfide isomerase/thioredoxin
MRTRSLRANHSGNRGAGVFRLAMALLSCAFAPEGLVSGGLADQQALKVGDRFPDLKQFQIEGELPESFGGKVVVLEFWASWCGRCKGSFEVMEELNTRFAKQGLVILGVNVDESRAAMGEFLKEHPVTFNIVRDKTKSLVRAINIPSMPTLIVLDKDGKVHSIHQSFHAADTRAKCIAEIGALLRVSAVK